MTQGYVLYIHNQLAQKVSAIIMQSKLGYTPLKIVKNNEIPFDTIRGQKVVLFGTHHDIETMKRIIRESIEVNLFVYDHDGESMIEIESEPKLSTYTISENESYIRATWSFSSNDDIPRVIDILDRKGRSIIDDEVKYLVQWLYTSIGDSLESLSKMIQETIDDTDILESRLEKGKIYQYKIDSISNSTRETAGIYKIFDGKYTVAFVESTRLIEDIGKANIINDVQISIVSRNDYSDLKNPQTRVSIYCQDPEIDALALFRSVGWSIGGNGKLCGGLLPKGETIISFIQKYSSI